ncbi:hypothetical protein DEM27_32000 [Metarhizobium album]|uniref:DUF930 domain-containing protein n=2 Tax=Metarhizobium album TaxID=2182425 RepID=A0A2U2DGA1_9HYPH|nr:hypothetical protein DEM27_32000 [Rhizobium album]
MVASFAVHAVFALLLIFGFPVTLPEPQKEDSVSVDIVEQPPEKAKEEAKPTEKKDEAAQPPEKQARMTSAEKQPSEDAKDATSGAAPPTEQQQAFESVPQVTEEAKDTLEPEEMADKQTEDKPKTADAKPGEISQRQMTEVDKDALREAMRQAAEREKAAEQQRAAEEAKAAEQKPAAEKQAAEQKKAEALAILAARQAADAKAAEAKAELAKADPVAKPEEKPTTAATATDAPSDGEAETKAEAEKADATSGDQPAVAEVMPDDSAFTQAKKLFSKASLSDPRVKKALGKLPPNRRIVQICTIEALEQVRHSARNSVPEGMVPFSDEGGLIAGPKLSASGGAFFSGGKWYAIDFSCETNAEVTEITAFRFDIKGAIPRNEWKSRKLPEP